MFRKRPFGVTLLLWLVLTLIVWGAVRFSAALRWRAVLTEFGSSLSVNYLSITGAGWGVVGCVLLWGMFTGKLWTRVAILTSVLVWLIQYWLERIFFESVRANLPFAITSSIMILGIAWTCALHKSTRNFLTKSEAYEQQNESTNSE